MPCVCPSDWVCEMSQWKCERVYWPMSQAWVQPDSTKFSSHREDVVGQILPVSRLSTSAEQENIKLVHWVLWVCGRSWGVLTVCGHRWQHGCWGAPPQMRCHWKRMIFEPHVRMVGHGDSTPTVAPLFPLQCLCLLLPLSLSVFFSFTFHVTS